MAKSKGKRTVLRPGGARRLLEGAGAKMTDDERALLLAMMEAETGHLTPEEQEALQNLKGQGGSYDTEELTRAVEHMVTAEPRKGRKLKWPELKQRLAKLRKRRQAEE